MGKEEQDVRVMLEAIGSTLRFNIVRWIIQHGSKSLEQLAVDFKDDLKDEHALELLAVAHPTMTAHIKALELGGFLQGVAFEGEVTYEVTRFGEHMYHALVDGYNAYFAPIEREPTTPEELEKMLQQYQVKILPVKRVRYGKAHRVLLSKARHFVERTTHTIVHKVVSQDYTDTVTAYFYWNEVANAIYMYEIREKSE